MANNSYDIFQLKNDDSTRELRFEGLRRLAKMGAKVQRENYDLIYNAPLGEKDTLDSIYEKFNLYHPEDFRSHSLSVSDIVVFHKDGVDTAYYVDSFGFAEVPEFLLVQAMEKPFRWKVNRLLWRSISAHGIPLKSRRLTEGCTSCWSMIPTVMKWRPSLSMKKASCMPRKCMMVFRGRSWI